MVERVVVVDGRQVAAEGVANVIMGTYIGIGAIMYGLYWLVGFFTPRLLEEGLGILTFLIAPGAILLCAFLLLIVLVAAISFEDPITQLAYAAGIGYVTIPVVRDMGLIGYSSAGKYIGFFIIFAVVFSLLKALMQYPKVLKATKILGGIIIFSLLLFPFSSSTMDILYAAGWVNPT
ncbi:hypothetical protein [Microbulbifer aggregans]|uniref:hypothetical protein n=1 Tax=Microbulbifer aggregans TaxID=1769779 RepID=UPI001CFD00E8|nr:hypothetical protein [Microbulbifer aggregans]